MSGLDADGTPLNNPSSGFRGPSPLQKPSFGQEAPVKNSKPFYNGLAIAVAIGAVLGLIGYGANEKFIHHSAVEAKPDTVVAFSADPSGRDDSPIQLGYPDHIYSVTCTANNAKDCVLEVDNGTSHTIKRFPYVEQEWFSPGRKNRPYHTLDVILSLPSLNGNPELKMGTDPAKNKDLVQVLRQNGWIAN